MIPALDPRPALSKRGCSFGTWNLELGTWNLGRDEPEEEFHRAKAFKEEEEEDGVREVEG